MLYIRAHAYLHKTSTSTNVPPVNYWPDQTLGSVNRGQWIWIYVRPYSARFQLTSEHQDYERYKLWLIHRHVRLRVQAAGLKFALVCIIWQWKSEGWKCKEIKLLSLTSLPSTWVWRAPSINSWCCFNFSSTTLVWFCHFWNKINDNC